jgi:serine/threonine protein kinase
VSGSGFDLGPFAVEAVVGEGGMGRVWRGSHRRQAVPVAVKVLNERFCTPKFANAFRNEARAVAQLDHPHIVVILDYGLVPQGGIGPLAGRSPYLVMDYASGGSLDKIELPLPFDLVKTILLTMLDALAHAHARSVIHRDLKPGNIQIGRASCRERVWLKV